MKKFIKIFISLTIVYGFIGCAGKQVIQKNFQKNFKINKNTKEVKSEANKTWKELDKEK